MRTIIFFSLLVALSFSQQYNGYNNNNNGYNNNNNGYSNNVVYTNNNGYNNNGYGNNNNNGYGNNNNNNGYGNKKPHHSNKCYGGMLLQTNDVNSEGCQYHDDCFQPCSSVCSGSYYQTLSSVQCVTTKQKQVNSYSKSSRYVHGPNKCQCCCAPFPTCSSGQLTPVTGSLAMASSCTGGSMTECHSICASATESPCVTNAPSGMMGTYNQQSHCIFQAVETGNVGMCGCCCNFQKSNGPAIQTATRCDNDADLPLTCATGTTINIVIAIQNYTDACCNVNAGTPAGCVTGGTITPGVSACCQPGRVNTCNVALENKSTAVAQLCQGQVTCSLNTGVAAQGFAPDPCPGTLKQLTVEYQCV